MNTLQLCVAGSFHTKKHCSRFFSRKVRF